MNTIYQICRKIIKTGIRVKDEIYNGCNRFLDWAYSADTDYKPRQNSSNNEKERTNNQNIEDKLD